MIEHSYLDEKERIYVKPRRRYLVLYLSGVIYILIWSVANSVMKLKCPFHQLMIYSDCIIFPSPIGYGEAILVYWQSIYRCSNFLIAIAEAQKPTQMDYSLYLELQYMELNSEYMDIWRCYWPHLLQQENNWK